MKNNYITLNYIAILLLATFGASLYYSLMPPSPASGAIATVRASSSVTLSEALHDSSIKHGNTDHKVWLDHFAVKGGVIIVSCVVAAVVLYYTIFNAITLKHTKYLRTFLESGKQADEKNEKKEMLSAYNRQSDCIKYLLHHGTATTFKGQEDKTALESAKKAGKYDVVNYPIALQKWFTGAATGNRKLLESLSNTYHINVNAINEYGSTALILSSRAGHLDCVKFLLQQGADINTSAKYAYTALLLSAYYGHLDCIKFLLQQGADINTRNARGSTALTLSAQQGHLDCVKFLVQQGVNIHDKNKNNDTALIISAYKGHLDCVKFLLQQGADIYVEHSDASLKLVASAGSSDVESYLKSAAIKGIK